MEVGGIERVQGESEPAFILKGLIQQTIPKVMKAPHVKEPLGTP